MRALTTILFLLMLLTTLCIGIAHAQVDEGKLKTFQQLQDLRTEKLLNGEDTASLDVMIKTMLDNFNEDEKATLTNHTQPNKEKSDSPQKEASKQESSNTGAPEENDTETVENQKPSKDNDEEQLAGSVKDTPTDDDNDASSTADTLSPSPAPTEKAQHNKKQTRKATSRKYIKRIHADVTFEDGRQCADCYIFMNRKNGTAEKVTLRDGTRFDMKPGQKFTYIKHRSRFWQAIGQGMQEYSRIDQQQRQQQQQYYQQQQNNRLNCTTNYIGSTAHTNCY